MIADHRSANLCVNLNLSTSNLYLEYFIYPCVESRFFFSFASTLYAYDTPVI